jgi:hypothetical protein
MAREKHDEKKHMSEEPSGPDKVIGHGWCFEVSTTGISKVRGNEAITHTV